MDALEELREMHVAAKDAFRRIESTSDVTQRAGMWAKLRSELELHEKIEEQFVYDPVARDVGSRDALLRAWEKEHEQQARSADAMIDEIGKHDPRDAMWIESFRALVEMMDTHIAHEEREIWPKIRSEWGEQNLEKAGRSVGAAKAAGTAGATVAEAIGNAVQAVKGR